MGITFWRSGEEPGERAEVTAIYTLPDGTRVRIKAGDLIPAGAVPDAVRNVSQRAKKKPQNRARKAAPENR